MTLMCEQRKDKTKLGGDRCGKPAAYESMLGYCCEDCVGDLRRVVMDPNSLINILSGTTI